MSVAGSSPLAGRWTAAAHQLLERLLDEQGNAISKAAQWCFESISNDGVVHLFGTGHSRIPIEEMGFLQREMSEALRVLEKCGRLVVRYSGTEPILRIMIESDDDRRNANLMDRLESAIQKDFLSR